MAKKSLYGVHPGVEMIQQWVATLKPKTGKSLQEWMEIVQQSSLKSDKDMREWLKREYGLGTNSAWWIVDRALGRGEEEGDPESYLKAAFGYVEDQYAGKKAHLRPIYDELLKIGLKIGKGVKACPCKTIVPLYRNHVFAQLKAPNQSRVDLGLALKNMKTPKRLIDTGGFEKKDRISRRIEISSLDQIDDEVKHWLKVAYDLDDNS